MLVFDLKPKQQWNPEHHVERVLGKVSGGDFTVACWEPGQISPYHCHPNCTEIYFCYEGGGKMRTPERTVDIVPGSFVVHPPGELHEYVNGPQRTMLFRVRYGTATNRARSPIAAMRAGSKRPKTSPFSSVIRSCCAPR